MRDSRSRADFIATLAVADERGGMLTAEQVASAGDLDLHDAAATQLGVLLHHIAAGDGLAGWKVGMTSGDNRDKMGPGVRPFGFVRRSRLFQSGDAIPLSSIPGPGIEPELGVRIGRAIGGPDLSRAEVVSAIDAAVPCFELGQRRLTGGSEGVRVAADLSQWGVVAGEPAVWAGEVGDLVVDLWRDDERIATAGPGFPIDDPVESLRALCAGLAPFGLGLLPGQLVITGAFAKARVTGAGRWRAEFRGAGTAGVGTACMGTVQIEFTGEA